MSKDLESLPLSVIQSSVAFDYKRQKRLLRGFWLVALALLSFELFFSNTTSLESNFGAILITTAALLPTYLWCSGNALGMPIFPLFALTYIWTHALPLVSNHPTVLQYSPASHLFASITVSGCLGLGTFIWLQFVKSAPAIPESYLVLDSGRGEQFFLISLAAYVVFNMSNLGGWLSLDFSVFSIIRSIILGLTLLSTFVLSYRLGTKDLSKQRSWLFLCLLITGMLTSTATLLLVDAASLFLIATISFIIGRKKLPILLIIVALICFSFLNYGKSEMRAKYWFGGQIAQLQPWDYPAWYSEWAGYSLNYLLQNQNDYDSTVPQSSEEKASFFERASVIQMLLLTQSQSPQEIPYLYGATYAILPQLLVPRILSTNKIASHEGTYILNIHYGLQTREDTFKTTIGWGLLAESYANFGLVGCAGLAVLLGSIYGQATRWSINAPVLSARYLFAMLIMSLSFQSEYSAGVYVAALFQSSISLTGIAVLLMRAYKVPRVSV
ncbi:MULTISPECIES: hypothetical protein [unclassified Tolypothrix]|uniref:hypothetical protein n=1 Tax=unclassified Tolypothrix TaxID=2649714 RepID=UPI0005EAB0A8|nr:MULTISPECIES: hypothetical protein [unclassified Tolypothrix]BAY92041.1 hypothetical protein NIES3275_40720 [Microchaete diplosiphon NIES-3275]EKF04763.1 hypothetical protein FDUTEX481_00921 [Tolypothrix sp. PCC 7601]MBE9081754.1 hypothetical protein [Tolypothrix sp. LEGE 11397]UYD26029.1 hypothetical protein HGR01_32765 [Tolypothrix sp. PCC 7712]UYD31732.1 hypothetical protein HG267_21760 [Tolypothrix sp. PCC 7601]